MREEKALVRLRGIAVEILNELVERGYFDTKSEAFRAGVVALGESYGLVTSVGDYWNELGKTVRRRAGKLTHDEIVGGSTGLRNKLR